MLQWTVAVVPELEAAAFVVVVVVVAERLWVN